MSASLFKLARGVFSQDMNLFRYKTKSTASRSTRFLFPVAIAAVIMFAVAFYANEIITPLASLGLATLLPALFIIFFTIISLFEGIYKSSSILFDCKDDALLFSLPIPRHRIFAVRVLKLLAFQTLYNAIFMLPAFVVYAIRTNPEPIFYPTAILMLVLTPLIPTALAVLIGYIVKALSLKSRFQKSTQTILTFAALAAVGLLIINAQDLMNTFIENAASIAEVISRIYYPAGAFTRLITDFQPSDLFGLLAACILPLLAVIYLCSIRYFRLISKTNTHATSDRQIAITGHQSSTTTALVKREVSRYLSSSVFVFNSLFGLILLLVSVILISINFDGIAASLFSVAEEGFDPAEILAMLPNIYTAILIFMLTMTSITSSSISIEGKTFLITRSLPVSPAQLLLSKLLASLVITYPLIFICDLIFIIRFAVSPLATATIIATSILVPIFTGLIGLLMNLKYPKMNASSDAEVVKQSASSMFAVFIGMITGIAAIAAIMLGHGSPLVAIAAPAFFLFADLILWRLLSTWGIKKFRQIEV